MGRAADRMQGVRPLRSLQFLIQEGLSALPEGAPMGGTGGSVTLLCPMGEGVEGSTGCSQLCHCPQALEWQLLPRPWQGPQTQVELIGHLCVPQRCNTHDPSVDRA